MKHYERTIYILLSGVLLLAVCSTLQSCRDDAFDEYNVQYPDGETCVNVKFDFAPLASNKLSGRSSNAPNGDVVKELTDFSILFYDTRYTGDGASGKLMVYKHFSESDINNLANGITLVDRNRDRVDANASTGQKAEAKTTHVEAKIDHVPYGPYKVFVVANLGVNGNTTQSVLDANDISTPEALQSLKAMWDSDNMRNNAQMTGYFSEGEQTPSPGTSTPVELVRIKSPNMTLHSWLRRLTSKVTITYDPSGLRKGITVTIKKVTVRDIAMSCYLGQPNKVGPVDGNGLLNTDGLVDDVKNHYIEYDEPIVLTSETKDGSDYLQLDDNFNIPAHSETAKALFFFENMQGEVPDKDHNGKLQDGKLQDENGDGIIDYPNANDPNHDDYKDYKDGLKYGTYIEVEADYDARTVGQIGRGTIKYRFMVGKNVTTNCDAERNHHYKLKLRFMGNANEVDWHIDYDETPGFYGPNPYYVSYLYNRMTYYPIKISGELDPNSDIKLTIVQNAWWPNNAINADYFAKSEQGLSPGDDGVLRDTIGIVRSSLYHPTGDNNSLEPWGGFLSLAQNMDNQNTNVALGLNVIGNGDQAQKYLYNYWIGENTETTNKNGTTQYTANDTKQVRGTRTYKIDAASDPNNNREKGTYTVTKEVNSTTFNVPFFTREKQIQKTTGYTGNNPYVAYQREAKVLLEYQLLGEKSARIDSIKVYQVRRIVNPTGIWRRHDYTTPFHVNLKYQETEADPNFKSLKSNGPWRAYISRGNTNFIKLNGKNEVRNGDGTEIDFLITFNGTIAETENRCAVIRVEYNNYSCHHLIFVRQGSAPIQMNAKSTVKWHTANVTTTKGTGTNLIINEGQSPLDEGSMFRYSNLEKGIAAKSNPMYSKEINAIRMEPEDFDYGAYENNDPIFPLLSDGTKNGKWTSMTDVAEGAGNFPDVKIEGKGETLYRVATITDFKTLIPDGQNNEEMDFGYGVLYGNDAEITATTIQSAYGYDASDPETKTYGMRGAFVYNSSTSVATFGGNNLFFPIGRSGYGRRRANTGWAEKVKPYKNHNGALQYATRSNYYTKTDINDAKFVPLFYDLFRSHGALYWMKQITNNQKTLDINYHTLDFNISDMGHNGAATNSDACFVRLVE